MTEAVPQTVQVLDARLRPPPAMSKLVHAGVSLDIACDGPDFEVRDT